MPQRTMRLVPRRSLHWASPAASLLAAALAAAPAGAQTPDDGLLVPGRQLRVSVEYGDDRWDEYWEGERRRSNGNIGTLTTRSVTAMAAYGVSDRLSVFAALPYVWTEASAGVLHGMRGRQDLTLAAKYQALKARVGGRATFGALLTAGVSAPASDYTPDFLPLSIGLASRRASGRLTLHLQDRSGWFVEGGAGHTWRANVRLDRPAYYTDGRLYSTNEVAMPDVAEYSVGAGYQRGRLCLPIAFVTQRTLGGGDIRRQDMPFVSNRMNSSRLQAHAMYALPLVSGVWVNAGAARTLTGRNVGRSTTLTGGFTYALGR
jgi:hypothetical protein